MANAGQTPDIGRTFLIERVRFLRLRLILLVFLTGHFAVRRKWENDPDIW